MGDRVVRAALYVRVSTAEQHLEQQLHGLRREAKARGWRVVGVYQEKASTRAERPEFQRLMRDALMRRCDAVLFWRLDRLGGRLLEVLHNAEKLTARGVLAVSVKDGALDTTTAGGRLQLHMLAACAEFERAVLRERTREGLARVRRQGSASGRPIGRPRMQLDDAAVRARLVAGAPWAEVARDVGCCARTLRRRFPDLDKKGGAKRTPPATRRRRR